AFEAEMAKGIRMHCAGDSQDLLSFASPSFVPDSVALASGRPFQPNGMCDQAHLECMAKLMKAADRQRRSVVAAVHHDRANWELAHSLFLRMRWSSSSIQSQT
ncbi:unnamed protein product, partial [Polarella glacialis]